jgi:hypothetical protein
MADAAGQEYSVCLSRIEPQEQKFLSEDASKDEKAERTSYQAK